jgi:Mg-chelatase subunit ChlD
MTRPITWFLLLWLTTLSAWAETKSAPSTIRLNQAEADLPTTTVWLNVEDSQGKALSDLKVEQFSATIGEWTATPQLLRPFADSGEGVAYIFMVDVSKSLSAKHFEQMKASLAAWIHQLRDVDSAALLRFGSKVDVLQDFSHNKDVLKRNIAAFAVTDDKTLFYQALLRGLELGRRSDVGLPKRRVVVVLTDGIDDAPPGSPTQDEVLRSLREHQIPIYAIAVKHTPQDNKEKQGQNTLGIIVRASGGLMLESDIDGSLKEAYAKQYQAIQKSLVLNVNCPDCRADAKTYPLVVSLQDSTRILKTKLDLPLLSKTPAKKDVIPSSPSTTQKETEASAPEWPETNKLWGYMLGGTGTLLFIYVLYLLRKRKPLMGINMNEGDSYNYEEYTQEIENDNKIHEPENDLHQTSKAKLLFTVVTGQEVGRRYEIFLTEPIVLGREQTSTIYLMGDDWVSPNHAEISLGDRGLLYLKDLGSTNGTVLNGVRLTFQHVLQDGDLILLGRTELRLNILENPAHEKK